MTDEDKKKLKELENFKEDFEKLLRKYPTVCVGSDYNDDLRCWIGLSSCTHSLFINENF